MEKDHWQGYLDRVRDLGEQMLDLYAEMESDPPTYKAGVCFAVQGIPIVGEVN